MARSTTRSYWRQYADSQKNATPAVFVACIQFTIDISQASADTGKVLPKGALPLYVTNITGNGSALSTVDIGTQADPDGYGNEIAGDATTAPTVGGALLGTELTANTSIYAGAGDTAGTGDVTFGVYYIMADDGSYGV